MYTFRAARCSDLVAIIDLLADDDLGQAREIVSDPPDVTRATLRRLPPSRLCVAVDQADSVAGVLQLSFIPGLSRRGMWRGQIESVRIARHARGSGLGSRFIEWAMERCIERGCGLVQLTSDKSRPVSIRFYEKLGFVASHEGLKRPL